MCDHVLPTSYIGGGGGGDKIFHRHRKYTCLQNEVKIRSLVWLKYRLQNFYRTDKQTDQRVS